MVMKANSLNALRAFAFVGMILTAGPLARGQPVDENGTQPDVVAEFDIFDDGDFLLVPLIISGKTYPFILDTGASWVVFDDSLRAFLGEPQSRAAARTPSSPIHMELFHAPHATVGPIPLRGHDDTQTVLVGCLDLGGMRVSCGHEIYGVLGMPFLRRHVIQVDFEHRKLLFLDAVGADPGIPISLEFQKGGLPKIHAKLAGEIKTTLLVDTGMSATAGTLTLPMDLIHKLEQKGFIREVRKATVADASGTHKARSFRLTSLNLANFMHTDCLLHEDSGGLAGKLGLGYLVRYTVTFDFPNKVMYVKPNQQFSKPACDYCAAASDFGISVTRKNDQIVMSAIWPGTAAARLGLRRSDVLLAVDRTDVRAARLITVYKLFHDAAGHRVALTVKRGNRTMRLAE